MQFFWLLLVLKSLLKFNIYIYRNFSYGLVATLKELDLFVLPERVTAFLLLLLLPPRQEEALIQLFKCNCTGSCCFSVVVSVRYMPGPGKPRLLFSLHHRLPLTDSFNPELRGYAERHSRVMQQQNGTSATVWRSIIQKPSLKRNWQLGSTRLEPVLRFRGVQERAAHRNLIMDSFVYINEDA